MIGSLGGLVFSVSSNKVLTFRDLNISRETRYGTHDTLQGKPKLEFTGENIDEITLVLSWRIENNVNPEKEIQILEQARKRGKVIHFILGGRRVGSGKYVITNITSAPKRIDNRGNFLSVDYSITLREYALQGKPKEAVRKNKNAPVISTNGRKNKTVSKKKVSAISAKKILTPRNLILQSMQDDKIRLNNLM